MVVSFETRRQLPPPFERGRAEAIDRVVRRLETLNVNDIQFVELIVAALASRRSDE
jgi:hypothetical protein